MRRSAHELADPRANVIVNHVEHNALRILVRHDTEAVELVSAQVRDGHREGVAEGSNASQTRGVLSNPGQQPNRLDSLNRHTHKVEAIGYHEQMPDHPVHATPEQRHVKSAE